jgi:hypothetical protein
MIEELTSDVTSIESIQTAIELNVEEALVVLSEAAEEAEAEVPQLLGLSTTSTTTTSCTVTMTITTTQS